MSTILLSRIILVLLQEMLSEVVGACASWVSLRHCNLFCGVNTKYNQVYMK